ncbi:MAG: RHS repeat-associated core domain-containing protein [Microthrixaceae bacterium]|nr:RHS repeat-associated core domain-containing protein [Microthrixaceae bacterium]
MIIPLTDTGTFTIGSWTQTDVAVDVIGVFKAPTRTWRYEYDTTGMRTAKQLDDTAGTGAEWRKEHTWTASGGLPLLLAEHQGAQSAYVIYGPGGTPIYQINTTGDVQYFHQDHQGSTRLTTNPNGTTRNTITYNAHGEITANTNWWLEQPLAGYTSQYHDPETGYIYLRARHYDPTTGQFTTQDPLVALTEEPYGYVGGNPANRADPSGLSDCGNPKDWGDVLGSVIDCASKVALPGPNRLPDYITIDLGKFVPIGNILAGPGGGLNIVITRYGDVFIGPEVGVGTAGWSGAVRAGWISTGKAPCRDEVNAFVEGNFVSAGGSVKVLQGGVTISQSGQIAEELGLGLEGASGLLGRTFRWFRLPSPLRW